MRVERGIWKVSAFSLMLNESKSSSFWWCLTAFITALGFALFHVHVLCSIAPGRGTASLHYSAYKITVAQSSTASFFGAFGSVGVRICHVNLTNDTNVTKWDPLWVPFCSIYSSELNQNWCVYRAPASAAVVSLIRERETFCAK